MNTFKSLAVQSYTLLKNTGLLDPIPPFHLVGYHNYFCKVFLQGRKTSSAFSDGKKSKLKEDFFCWWKTCWEGVIGSKIVEDNPRNQPVDLQGLARVCSGLSCWSSNFLSADGWTSIFTPLLSRKKSHCPTAKDGHEWCFCSPADFHGEQKAWV